MLKTLRAASVLFLGVTTLYFHAPDVHAAHATTSNDQTRAQASEPAKATALKSGANGAASMNTYRDIFGKSVQTDVAVFTDADQKTVTPAVFKGYEQYNTYCSRCHGKDAVGGSFAPNLRKSMANGMPYPQFLATVLAGRSAKGMPSWAGVLEEKDIHAIYDYIKARQLDLIRGGRPPSD